MTVAATDASAREGSSDDGTFTLTRSHTMGELMVNYSLGGTADSADRGAMPISPVTFMAGQPTATVIIDAMPDNLVESSETVVLTVQPGMGYTAGTPSTDTVTIQDDPPRVRIHANDPVASENPTSDTAQFTLVREGGNVQQSLGVMLEVGGTAQQGSDYALMPLTSAFAFAAGQDTATFTVQPIDDTLVEGDETVQLRILPDPTHYQIVASPATALILDNDATTVVDVDIADGQFKPVLDESVEFTRGAYTVANWNDTDGDGRTDNVDQYVEARTQVVQQLIVPAGTSTVPVLSVEGFRVGDKVWITDGGDRERRTLAAVDEANNTLTFDVPLGEEYTLPTVTHGGRDEVDLMKLVISRPDPINPAGGMMTLRVLSGNVALWTDSTKEVQVPNTFTFDPATIGAGDPMEVWVEAKDPSTGLRDIVIELEYNGVKDVVRATGIWASATNWAHNSGDQFGVGTVWEDINGPAKDALTQLGGAGLRPIDATIGVRNAIFTQYTIYPYRDVALDGTWEDDDVRFDATRQQEGKTWFDPGSGFEGVEQFRFPINPELPNDDQVPDGDDGDAPTDMNHYYNMDAPGFPTNVALVQAWVYRRNFSDWLRVGVGGADPDVGDAPGGSRASQYFDWHATHSLEPDPNSGTPPKWRRTTGDGNEVQAVNDVDLFHIVIPDEA